MNDKVQDARLYLKSSKTVIIQLHCYFMDHFDVILKDLTYLRISFGSKPLEVPVFCWSFIYIKPKGKNNDRLIPSRPFTRK